jgi:aminopeptidase-like protein
MNKRGDRWQPWDTPDITVVFKDKWTFILTQNDLLHKYDESHDIRE